MKKKVLEFKILQMSASKVNTDTLRVFSIKSECFIYTKSKNKVKCQ